MTLRLFASVLASFNISGLLCSVAWMIAQGGTMSASFSVRSMTKATLWGTVVVFAVALLRVS